jgi:hypothetical protein
MPTQALRSTFLADFGAAFFVANGAGRVDAAFDRCASKFWPKPYCLWLAESWFRIRVGREFLG